MYLIESQCVGSTPTPTAKATRPVDRGRAMPLYNAHYASGS